MTTRPGERRGSSPAAQRQKGNAMSMRQTAAVDNALRRIKDEKISAYRAATEEGIALSTIYRALNRQKEQLRRNNDARRKREKRAASKKR